MARSLVNRIGGYGAFAFWLAHSMEQMRAHYQERDEPLPIPESLCDFPVVALTVMAKLANYEMPPDKKIRLSIAEVPLPGPTHKHYDRHGAEISCETFHFLHNRAEYGVVGTWENDSGNTAVSTIWIGDEDCRFQTRVMSTDTRWHNHTVNYEDQEAARAGHEDIIRAIRAYPPQ